MFNHLRSGIWMKDLDDKKMTFASKGLEEILQLPSQTLYGKSDYWKDMILPEYREEVFSNYNLLLEGKRVENKFQIKDGNGETKWVFEQVLPRVDASGKVIQLFGVLTDITSEINMQQRLEFLAENDPLTTLPNYRSLDEKLDELIAHNQVTSFALLFMEIDNFKSINDFLGYEVGDSVIKTIADRLKRKIFDKRYLANVGGNGFVLIIPNYRNKDDIFQFSKELMKIIDEKVVVKGYEYHVTASIGISFYPKNGNDKITLIANARKALHLAKQLGKNNYQIYSFNKDISSHKKYLLEKDLRKAIQHEEFELYYQPQVDAESGAIKGAEALIRWNHEEWGTVSPAEFIPIAEEKHLIHHIGNWVIKTVCSQLHHWKERGFTLFPISINVSPIQFLKPGIVQFVKKELKNYQIPAKYIEIEITETSLLRNEKHVLETINGFQNLGVKLALDDFGTAYSSFHYLQEFNLDTLKIDRSFIQQLDINNENEQKGQAIISSIIHLAKGLNMKIIAEGVEEYEQLDFLKQKECDLIQGYLFSKPVPIDAFEQMMESKYLQPKKQKKLIIPNKERRKFPRFKFPAYLPAKMLLTEVNKKKMNMGSATILIENISIGGAKILSLLKLPVSSNTKLNLKFEIMNIEYCVDGILVYKNEEKSDVYSYGVSFQMNEERKRKISGNGE